MRTGTAGRHLGDPAVLDLLSRPFRRTGTGIEEPDFS
jgi:hypothetical protein